MGGGECRNALTWRSTIKWENVCIFITLPPFLPLPCYPLLLLGGGGGYARGSKKKKKGVRAKRAEEARAFLWLLSPPEPFAEGQLEASAGQLLTSPPPPHLLPLRRVFLSLVSARPINICPAKRWRTPAPRQGYLTGTRAEKRWTGWEWRCECQKAKLAKEKVWQQ